MKSFLVEYGRPRGSRAGRSAVAIGLNNIGKLVHTITPGPEPDGRRALAGMDQGLGVEPKTKTGLRWKFWLLAILLAWFGRDGVRGQQKQPVSSLQEDCGVTFAFSTVSSGVNAAGTVTAGSTGTTPVIDNRQAGCLDWLVTYNPSTTATALSLLFQTATDVAGVPTTWSSYPGTLVTGINPNTAATSGGAVTEGTGVKYPFLRMNLTAKTGAGTVSGKLYGWKRRPTYVSIVAGGGCAGTIATPCVVAGPATDGAAVSGAPVRIGGKDGGGNTQDILTDTSGNLQVAVIGNAAVLSGQQTVTAAAVALATHAAKNVCVKALNGNSAAVFIGPAGITTATGFRMDPGDTICGPVANTNLNAVIAAAAIGDAVTWYSTN